MWMLFTDLGGTGLEVGELGLEVLEVGFEGGLVIRRGLDQIRLNDLGHLANAIDRVEDMFVEFLAAGLLEARGCLLYTSPSPRDGLLSRMPSSA